MVLEGEWVLRHRAKRWRMLKTMAVVTVLLGCTRGTPTTGRVRVSPTRDTGVTATGVVAVPPSGVVSPGERLARMHSEGRCELTDGTVAGEGETVGADDGCNRCRCGVGGWGCTRMACMRLNTGEGDGGEVH